MSYFTADVEKAENKVKERDGYVATVNLQYWKQRHQRLTFVRVLQDCWVALHPPFPPLPPLPPLPPPNPTLRQHSTIC